MMSEYYSINQEKWDRRFLTLAKKVASWSKDPSTKCGAVITRPDNSICSLGYNGFPSGMDDDKERYDNRPMKYSRVIHAEMNAAMFAREPIKGYTLYTYPRFCCDRCAAHMIQFGIKNIISPRWDDPRSKHEIDLALDYCRECNVTTKLLDIENG